MFTPPPSPSPPILALKGKNFDNSESESSQNVDCQIPSKKKRTGRCFRLTTVLLPLFAVICTTYLLHKRRLIYPPAAAWIADGAFPIGHPQMHRRDPSPQQPPADSSSSSLSPTSTATKSSTSQVPVSDQIVPTVPDSAILPTPFPQAFDSGIVQNFSTSTCASFFANMTSAAPFRTCRPFSLLLESSGAFINAQTNLTLLNSIIWGTCNTPTPYEQCKANMVWFATSLQTNCAQELKERNVLVANTLIGFQAFEILHTASCQSDPNAHTYCYLTAARDSNPADLFIYTLPLGIHIPKSSSPTCSACSKSVMSVYADVLRSGGTGSSVLKTTFYEALSICQSGCGTDFSLVGAGLNREASGARRIGGYILMRARNVLILLGAWAVMFWFV